MSEFYDIDSTKATFKEFWDEANVLAIIGMVTKWLRIRTPASTDDANVDSTIPFVVQSLPAEALIQIQPLIDQLEVLGFSNPVWHFMYDPGTETTRYWATLAHSSGLHLARVQLRQWQRAAHVKRKPFVTFITSFAGGEFLTTTSGKPDLAQPATINYARRTGWPTERLWSLHEQRVSERAGQGILPAQSQEEIIGTIERHHVLVRDFQLGRGIFCGRAEKTKAKAEAFNTKLAEARASGLDHAEVVVELDKLQEKKPGWAGAIWILVGSVILFLAAGAAQWDWKFTLWLIPVIFFHEAGHWLAMRIFKYKNLRMFFIPFFGAAVTGQNWNVPGWKKVIVSLAGPLPGIALGCVLTVVALITQHPWLSKLSLILLLLNGFNLLPVLPLDGGHVLQAVLFCRNRWLDAVFRILAILGLVGLWMLGMGRLLIYIAIPMALFLPIAFKLAKVTDALRNTSLPPPLPDEDRIPTATAQSIISAIKAEVPHGANNKMLATYTLNVFETLNARPPGVLLSIGLLALHAGGFLAACLFGLLLTLGMHSGGVGDFFKAAVRQPERPFACGEIQKWEGENAHQGRPSPRNLIITSLPNHRKAANAFAGLTNRLPANTRVTLFGESLMLTLPAPDDDAREKWFEELQTLSTNTFVAPSNQPVSVRLFFVAPTGEIATNLVHSLQGYFQNSHGMHLIPPWASEAQRPDFEKFTRARQDWSRIELAGGDIWRDPAMKDLTRKINVATKRGAVAEARRLAEEQEKLSLELQAKALERLRTGTNRIDGVLFDLHDELSKLDYTNRVARAELQRRIAAKLGEAAYEGDRPAAESLAFGANVGIASPHGLLIEISWLTLNDPSVSLPAIAEWLCRERCSTFKYDFADYFGFDSSVLENLNRE